MNFKLQIKSSKMQFGNLINTINIIKSRKIT